MQRRELMGRVNNSSHGQAYFRSKAKRTTNLASINSKEVAGLPVPELALAQQRDLLDELNRQAQAAEIKRPEAATRRQSAWMAFESALSPPLRKPKPPEIRCPAGWGRAPAVPLQELLAGPGHPGQDQGRPPVHALGKRAPNACAPLRWPAALLRGI